MLKEIIESIAREKRLEEEVVIQTLKEILSETVAYKYNLDPSLLSTNIEQSGAFVTSLEQIVQENNEEQDPAIIDIKSAKLKNPNIKIGEKISEILPFEIRQASVREILSKLQSRLNQLQKQKEFEFFSQKIGKLVVGYIKKVDPNEAIISFTEGESVLRKNKTLKSDILKVGSYIKLYVEDVKPSAGNQIILSRTHPNFIKELFAHNVPEIAEGLVEIVSIARDPGSLSKIAVKSLRSSIDPVRTCIGEHGNRIETIKRELGGEKIGIVRYSENISEFIANALTPAQVMKVNQKKENRFEVVANEEEFKKAMGRGGQNVFLAKKLCKAQNIKLITSAEEDAIYKEQMLKSSQDLCKNLDIEEMMAHLLISEGFESAQDIADCTLEDLSQLNGFDKELATELKKRASKHIENLRKEMQIRLKEEYGDASLITIEQLSVPHIELLLQKNIYTKSDLAMLDAAELQELFESSDELAISDEIACEIIIKSRGIAK